MPDIPVIVPGAGGGAAGEERCDSCGRPDPPLAAVHRVYLELDRLGTVVGHRREPIAERWCPACLATYPHELPGPAGDGAT